MKKNESPIHDLMNLFQLQFGLALGNLIMYYISEVIDEERIKEGMIALDPQVWGDTLSGTIKSFMKPQAYGNILKRFGKVACHFAESLLKLILPMLEKEPLGNLGLNNIIQRVLKGCM